MPEQEQGGKDLVRLYIYKALLELIWPDILKEPLTLDMFLEKLTPVDHTLDEVLISDMENDAPVLMDLFLAACKTKFYLLNNKRLLPTHAVNSLGQMAEGLFDTFWAAADLIIMPKKGGQLKLAVMPGGKLGIVHPGAPAPGKPKLFKKSGMSIIMMGGGDERGPPARGA